MPITAAPASPFAARAFADAAGGQITDRREAVNAQRQAQAAQNYTQASIASAGNLTRASENEAEMDAQRQFQARQIDFQRQGQLREFHAQREQQERAQAFEMAKMNVAITQQEVNEQTRRVNGLAAIKRQVTEGILTPEQAGDAEYELLTGINAFQRRQQFQQSKAMEQQAAMRERETADFHKAAATSEKFMLDMALKGITVQPFINPETGRQSFLAYDMKTGRLYNPLLEHAGKGGEGEPAGGEWAHLGTKQGGFDEKKGLIDAKAFVEGQNGPRPSEANNPKGAAAWDRLVTESLDGRRREFRSASQQAPVTAPQQGQQAPSQPQPVQQPPDAPVRGRSVLDGVDKINADPFVQKIQADERIPPAQKEKATQLYLKSQQLMAKPQLTLQERDQLQILRSELAALMKRE